MRRIYSLAEYFRTASLSRQEKDWLQKLMPDNHSLFWVYGNTYEGPEKGYVFDTHDNYVDAKKTFAEFISDGCDDAFIFWGDKDGPFTNIDPVDSYYSSVTG